MSLIDMVKEFHLAFNVPIAESVGLDDVPFEIRMLRPSLLNEEFEEYIAAENAGDIVEIADALGDMMYIIAGTALSYGINLDSVLDEIHRSNMDKLDSYGKPILRADGKIIKPTSWTAPDIATALGI